MPTAPMTDAGPAGGIADTIGTAFYGDHWHAVVERGRETAHAEAAHEAAVRRLELVRRRAETVQAVATTVVLATIGVLVVVLLAVLVAKVAAL